MKRNRILLGLGVPMGLLLFSSSSFSQTPMSKTGDLRDYQGVPGEVWVDLASNKVSFEPPAEGCPTKIYDNAVLESKWFVAENGQEIIDEGALKDRWGNLGGSSFLLGASSAFEGVHVDQINMMSFAYVSTQPDPEQNSGSLTIHLYSDTIPGEGPRSTPIRSYDISGLPLGGPNGERKGWRVHVDLRCGFESGPNLDNEFPTEEVGVVNRRFGFGVEFDNPDTGLLLARGGHRNHDSFVLRDENEQISGQYWFDGQYFAGFYLKLFGPELPCFRYGPSQPCPGNVGCLHGSGIVIGRPTEYWIENPNPAYQYELWLSNDPAVTTMDTASGIAEILAYPAKRVLMRDGKAKVLIQGRAADSRVYAQVVVSHRFKDLVQRVTFSEVDVPVPAGQFNNTRQLN